jgi:hypothetical protein
LTDKTKEISALIDEEINNNQKIEENINKAKETYLYKPKTEKHNIINEIN